MGKEASMKQESAAVELVLLEEIGHLVGGSAANAKSFATEQGVPLVADALGRDGVMPGDAHKLVTSWSGRMRALQEREAAYQAWKADKEAEFAARLRAEAERRLAEEKVAREMADEAQAATVRTRLRKEAEALRARRLEEAARLGTPDLSREAWEREQESA